jgi:hypothetical protein
MGRFPARTFGPLRCGATPFLSAGVFGAWSSAPGHDQYPDPTLGPLIGDKYGINLHHDRCHYAGQHCGNVVVRSARRNTAQYSCVYVLRKPYRTLHQARSRHARTRCKAVYVRVLWRIGRSGGRRAADQDRQPIVQRTASGECYWKTYGGPRRRPLARRRRIRDVHDAGDIGLRSVTAAASLCRLGVGPEAVLYARQARVHPDRL